MTGYFTSEVGVSEIGYQGNVPNIWDGVPEDVLKSVGVAYDQDLLLYFPLFYRGFLDLPI